MAIITAEIIDNILYIKNTASSPDDPDSGETTPHIHTVLDTDRYFTIDPYSRIITYESDAKLSLVQYDHNSERFTFEIPRHVEGHDMSLCNKVKIHYMNVGSSGRYSDVYEVTDLGVSEDDDAFASFSWLISQKSTQYIGTLNFVIQFLCMDGEEITYAWHTTTFTGIKILDGMSNTESVVEQYADALEAWFLRLEEAAIIIDPTEAVNAVDAAKQRILDDVKAHKDNLMSDINAALEKIDPDKAVAAVEQAADEIIANFDASIERTQGVVTLNVSDWSSNTQTKSISGLISNRGVFFTPITRADRDEAATTGIFVSATPGAVTFHVEKLPTADINLSYLVFGISTIDGEGSGDDIFAAICGMSARSMTLTVDVDSDSWVSDSENGGYYQDITVDSITDRDDPIVDVILGVNSTTNDNYLKAWACVTSIITFDGVLRLRADAQPQSAFQIQLKVVR